MHKGCIISGYTLLKVPDNPARHARNMMGPEIFKHNSVRSLCGFGVNAGVKDLPDLDVPFPTCSLRNNHACLDQYFTDGNIQFKGKRLDQR